MIVFLISGTVLFAVWAVAVLLTVGGIVERNADLRGSMEVLRYERNEGEPRSKRSAMKRTR